MAANNKTEMVDIGAGRQLVEQDIGLVEEVQMLKQHVADMYRAWIAGKAPIPPPPGFSNEALTLTLASPDHSSISPIEEQPKKDFGEFWLKWSEQVVRGDLMKTKDVVEPPQRQGPMVVLGKRPHAIYQPRGCLGNSPDHYFSPRESQRRTPLSKYPAPQNAYPPSQAYQKLPGSGFRPNQAFRNERLLKKEKAFTPIGESHARLFQKLKQVGMLKPIQIRTPNPLKCDFSLRCAYCSDAPGHDTEKCWKLKRAIQDLIDANKIEVKTPEALNTSEDPLPAQA